MARNDEFRLPATRGITFLSLVSCLLVAVWFSFRPPAVDAQESPANSAGDSEAGETAAEQTAKRPSREALSVFHDDVEPLLMQYCYECHGYGGDEGGITLDTLTDENLLADMELWQKVLKNVRARVMPPPEAERPPRDEVTILADWIKDSAFGIDPENIDPGQVTMHRLNRIEYQNTIRDLLGVDFNINEEFPPDAAGLGFDNIAELLSVSPLMLEKYLDAAEAVLQGAIPSESSQGFVVDPAKFRGRSTITGERVPFGNNQNLFGSTGVLTVTYRNNLPGAYRVELVLEVVGTENELPEESEFDESESSNTGHLLFTLQSGVEDEEVLIDQQFTPDSNTFTYTFDKSWTTEPHKFDFRLTSQGGGGRGGPGLRGRRGRGQRGRRGRGQRGRRGRGGRGGEQSSVPYIAVKSFTITPQRTVASRSYFPDDAPPEAPAEFREYVRRGLSEFGLHAYRRPIDPATVDRLVAQVEDDYRATSSFAQSIRPAMTMILCSPRFLYRIYRTEPAEADRPWAAIDEYSLATRLSYFLWSTTPDDELLDLAARGALRENLAAQIERMLADDKSQEFIENFTGQWLQTRNIMTWTLSEEAVLSREGISPPEPWMTVAVREAMVDETTLYFARIVREDRSLLELIDSDYTYLNEDLAWLYQYKEDEIRGPEMRLVELDDDSHRGGVLTHAGVLVVTSNADRTSPVKRGVYVLERFLGLRPHDPPPNVPGLEDVAGENEDEPLTFRQQLERHRADPLCASCHRLMDPIGLALEHYNALGTYREEEFSQPIDASGVLVTGESFDGLDELKQILMTDHRENIYRCITEKLLTYALGREVDYRDTETVDRIVARLEAEEGNFSALLMGVVESAPFQEQRLVSTTTSSSAIAEEPVEASH